MVKWCAFCQRFQGLVPPFERLEVSHGLCLQCLKMGFNWTPAQEARIQRLGDLAKRLWKAGTTQDMPEVKVLINEGIEAGVRPIDLLYGLAGPAMVQVGELWARNLITVQEEHQFTQICESFIDAIEDLIRSENKIKASIKDINTPKILLANVPGNEHFLGLRFARLGLLSIGLASEVIPAGASTREIVDSALKMDAVAVGLSVSMAEQLFSLQLILAALNRSKPGIRVFVSGGAVTEGLIPREALPENVVLMAPVFHESDRDFFTSILNLPSASIGRRSSMPDFSSMLLSKRGEQSIIRILVVEDDDGFAEMELEMLRSLTEPKINVERVTRLLEAKNRLARGDIDLVLLDLYLPDSFGIDTVVQLRHAFPSLPIVVLTGVGDEKLGILSIREGAEDYLLKNQLNEQVFPRLFVYAIERTKNKMLNLELITKEKKALHEAEHAIRTRDEFLSIASHELKTPLTSLRMQIQILEKLLKSCNSMDPKSIQALFESTLKIIELLDRDLERFGILIDTLMDLSQFQSGKFTLKKVEANLMNAVNEVVSRLYNQIMAACCEVRVEGDQTVSGYWDIFRLQQVIINLIMNAVKYAPGGLIDIKVRSEGDIALFEVQDYGPGIANKDIARIFDRFERASKGQGVAGLGLGLYIAKQIVQSHGGSISLRSILGQGTTFIVRLPKREVSTLDQLEEKTHEQKDEPVAKVS